MTDSQDDRRKALLESMEAAAVLSAARYTAKLNRILDEFGRDPHRLAEEIEWLRRGR